VLKADLTDPEIQERICKQLASEPNLVLVMGGPPCQNVSLIGTTGRRAATNKRRRFDQCPNAKTYVGFREIVKSLKTRFFVMENVTGLFAANEGRARQDIIDDFTDVYTTASVQVDAFDHGVPQHRQRVFVVGVLKGKLPKVAEAALAFLVQKLRESLNRASWKATFGEAVSDLPRIQASGGAEFGRHPQVPAPTDSPAWSLTEYQHAMKNGSHLVFNHVARRLAWMLRAASGWAIFAATFGHLERRTYSATTAKSTGSASLCSDGLAGICPRNWPGFSPRMTPTRKRKFKGRQPESLSAVEWEMLRRSLWG
jgi:site-specific DNA-cytosine methylase